MLVETARAINPNLAILDGIIGHDVAPAEVNLAT